MALPETARRALSDLTENDQVRDAVDDVAGQVGERFEVDPEDFLSARERGETAGTRLVQETVSLSDAGETLNRSSTERDGLGQVTNVISPMVIPERRSFRALLPAALLAIIGVVGSALSAGVSGMFGLEGTTSTFLGPHYWIIVVAVAVFSWWRRSIVMVPEGSAALVTRFGRLEHVTGPGRTLLLSPWKHVSYIVNTTREYPYNAPIREAPTHSGVKASVDLFLQFRIEDPAEFIFTLGAVNGFADKLSNAISEVTRALIYEQRAGEIYDLIGESTQSMLDTLNEQFLPAVRLTNANITHAEPSSQDYRMDLASPEMVRLAKEAYTYEYELDLKKQQTEGELNKELATLQESLSAIQADIATYQAQMDTALERETNRAHAVARQRMVEAETTANANTALLEAQSLDIRAVASAGAPEILEYRFEQDLLTRLAAISVQLPQVVRLAEGDDAGVDFLVLARTLVGSGEGGLFSREDLDAIREQLPRIEARIEGRRAEVEALLDAQASASQEAVEPPAPDAIPGEEAVEQLRESVTDEAVQSRVNQLGGADTDDGGPPARAPGSGPSDAPATPPSAPPGTPAPAPPPTSDPEDER